MTTPAHIIVIQSKEPSKRTKEERQQLDEYRRQRAEEFARVRRKVMGA